MNNLKPTSRELRAAKRTQIRSLAAVTVAKPIAKELVKVLLETPVQIATTTSIEKKTMLMKIHLD